jgi:hypothetical protein
MSRALNARQTGERTTTARRPAAARPSRQEKPLELESRFRIQEEDARWRRAKEKIIVVSAVAVILDACAVSTFLITSKAATSGDRQLGFLVLGQIIVLLVGVAVGKNFNWKG